MNPLRALLYILGAALVVVGIFMLFFETGLAEWVPPGIALAGLVILVGLFVLGLSEGAREGPRERDTDVHHTEHHHHDHK